MYGGGAIPPKLGDMLYSSGVKMTSIYGSTETGNSTYAFKRINEDEAAWDYMEFSKSMGIRWIPQGDGTYELQFLVSNAYVPGFKLLRGLLVMRYTYFSSRKSA